MTYTLIHTHHHTTAICFVYIFYLCCHNMRLLESMQCAFTHTHTPKTSTLSRLFSGKCSRTIRWTHHLSAWVWFTCAYSSVPFEHRQRQTARWSYTKLYFVVYYLVGWHSWMNKDVLYHVLCWDCCLFSCFFFWVKFFRINGPISRQITWKLIKQCCY